MPLIAGVEPTVSLPTGGMLRLFRSAAALDPHPLIWQWPGSGEDAGSGAHDEASGSSGASSDFEADVKAEAVMEIVLAPEPAEWFRTQFWTCARKYRMGRIVKYWPREANEYQSTTLPKNPLNSPT